MAKSKISTNYITIAGWMREDLDLKGVELIIYAIIYGFSQIQNSTETFNGSLAYLCEWTGASRSTVIRALNSLVEKKLIIKTSQEIKGMIYNQYRVNFDTQENIGGWCQNDTSSVKMIPNNIYTNNNDNNKDNSMGCQNDTSSVKMIPPYKEIVDYLNLKAGTNYRSTSKDTQAHIRARWNEGYTLDDFKRVIDNKVEEWISVEKMVQYLRPRTLFSTNFESYLNKPKKKSNDGIVSVKADPDSDKNKVVKVFE